jgi:hypothetical protein
MDIECDAVRPLGSLLFAAFFLACAQQPTSVLLKILDVFTWNNISDDLASLDPLLCNVAAWDVTAECWNLALRGSPERKQVERGAGREAAPRAARSRTDPSHQVVPPAP